MSFAEQEEGLFDAFVGMGELGEVGEQAGPERFGAGAAAAQLALNHGWVEQVEEVGFGERAAEESGEEAPAETHGLVAHGVDAGVVAVNTPLAVPADDGVLRDAALQQLPVPDHPTLRFRRPHHPYQSI